MYTTRTRWMRRLTILEITPTPRPPHKLLDSLPGAFEPRYRLRRISLLDLTPAPDTQRMITALWERESTASEGQVTRSPDWILRVDSKLWSAWFSY